MTCGRQNVEYANICEEKISALEKQNLDRIQDIGQKFVLQLNELVSKNYDQERKLKEHELCKDLSGLELKIPVVDGKSSCTTDFSQFQRIAEPNG